MPFCPNCGNQVLATDRFCSRCGAAQPVASAAGGADAGSRVWQNSALNNVSSKNASTLCYIPFIGWIAGLLVLAAERFRQDRITRFHAFQGLYLFVVWLLVDLLADNFHVGRPFRNIFNPLKLVVIGTWIFMLIQTSSNKLVKLPLLGELADRSVDEQK